MSEDSSGVPARRETARESPATGGLLVRRALAFAVDLGVVLGAVWAATGRRGRPLWKRLALTGALAALAGFGYHVVLEGAAGRTPGKAAAGVVVVMEDGSLPTYRAALVRTLWRVVDWLPAGYLLGVASIASSDRAQRLGDRRAGTVVVRAGPRSED